MNSFKLTFSILFISSVTVQSLAQETLQSKYDNMIESTETYEQYKVIPRTTLDGFWAEVADSLSVQAKTVSDLGSQLSSLQSTISTLESKNGEVQAKLDDSLTKNDTISFLNIPFSKLGYHLMVWLIILVLAVLGVIAYLMFIRSNKVTTRVKQDHEELIKEFDAHKDKARETQVKLKRELQTAINQLNERR